MIEPKVIETDLIESLDVSLRKIEFANHDGPPDAPHLTYFEFRLHFDDTARQDISVTMTAPYSDLADLEKQAWAELYALLRNFAELIRRKHDLPEAKFR